MFVPSRNVIPVAELHWIPGADFLSDCNGRLAAAILSWEADGFCYVWELRFRLLQQAGEDRWHQLAGRVGGHGREVAGLTQAAMGGEDTPLSPVSASAELGFQGIATLRRP